MLTFTSLASSSTGNAALVSCGDTHVLLDAGISAKQLSLGLRALGVAPKQLSAIFITHEHSDHVSGLPVFVRKKAGVPVYATAPTCQAWYRKNRCDDVRDLMCPQEPGSGVHIGPLWVESFPTPHDAACSVGYSVSGEGSRVVLCTDLGEVTPRVRQAVKGCDLLVCETNHDVEWVRMGPYPYHLKKRILGPNGHLSNEAGADLAAWAVEHGTRAVLLGHLSQTNNTPARAYQTVSRRLQAMGCDLEREIRLSVAPASGLSDTFRLEGNAVC